jgi:hypothetical protein
MPDNKKIKFIFHPYGFENKQHVVEKEYNGVMRRYLKGITSGVAVDGHGEKMTEACIRSFQDQAKRGDILLFAGKHGVDFTDDIGILTDSEILPNNDWLTEYRLYDESDGVGETTLEKGDKLWKQSKGLLPYKTPKQFGFSIEGTIPKEGILSVDKDGKKIMDKVLLDGVVVVPRPAYQTSISQAIYKALGEHSQWNVEKSIKLNFKTKIEIEQMENDYFRKRYQFQSLLENEVDRIMTDPYIGDKQEALALIFDEYKSVMLELVLNSAELFSIYPKGQLNVVESIYDNNIEKSDFAHNTKVRIIKSLLTETDKLINKLN